MKAHRVTLFGMENRHSTAVMFLAGLLAVIFAAPASAQLLQRPIAIENARIMLSNGRVIDGGTLILKGQRIAAVGTGIKAPLLAKRIDAKGKTITPGLIDPFSALGMAGATGGAASATRRAEDSFDPYDSAMLVDALRQGVTAVYISPGKMPGICGTGAVVRLSAGPERGQSYGRVLQSEAALCIDLGSSSSAIARLKTLAAVQKQFRDAKQHSKRLEDYEEDLAEYAKKIEEQAKGKKPSKEKPKPKPSAVVKRGDQPKVKEEAAKKEEDKKPSKPKRPARNPALDIVLRALDREIPVRVRAYRSEDILNALELAKTFSLDLILEGATEAHLVADQIAESKAQVILGRMNHDGLGRDTLFRRAIRRPGAALDAANIPWIVGSGAQTGADARFIGFNARLAGSAQDTYAPLQLLTRKAAETLGVADKIGQLRPKCFADFVIWSDDPMDPAARVLSVYVGGSLVYEAEEEGRS